LGLEKDVKAENLRETASYFRRKDKRYGFLFKGSIEKGTK
jgi:hypothetical protein